MQTATGPIDRIGGWPMLYLFNSAFRTLYRKNVLNTLFLPAGLTN
jgi:hypothetical protein